MDCVQRYYLSSSKRVYDYLWLWAALVHHSKPTSGIKLNPYPPFGLPTICYVGLASYLVLIGVYSSALSVANDVELRRSIRNSVQEDSELLGNIGEAQFEDLLQKKILTKTKSLSNQIFHETGIESSLQEHEIHDYVLTVISELKHRNGVL